MTRPDVSFASDADLDDVRALFREYAASIGFSLAFQGFDDELASLPGRYAPPSGRLLLARVDGDVAGCIAMRDVSNSGEPASCEMKRLFVRPRFHELGVGRALVEALVAEARASYATMKLDTVPAMKTAIALYESAGFRDIAPYTRNPIEGARFLELSLRERKPG